MREQKPLYSFEDGSDYLYDVRWSPIHPALFATVDGLGRLDIWNLNHDTELPTVSTVVEGMSALNRLIWSPNGQQLVVGDDAGRIAVYDVGEVSRKMGCLRSFSTNYLYIFLLFTSNWRFQRTTSGRVFPIHCKSSPTTALTFEFCFAIHPTTDNLGPPPNRFEIALTVSSACSTLLVAVSVSIACDLKLLFT